MKVRYVVAALAVASYVLMSAVGSARAADEWFVLSEQTLKAADQGVTIKSQGGRWEEGRQAGPGSASRVLTWRSSRSSLAGTIGRTTRSRISES